MSTTYTLDLVATGVIEIARTHYNGEKVEVTWLNPLAAILVDEETVMSDSGNPLCQTIGDLRELEVPKMWDEMTTYELMDEIKSMRDERDGVSMRLKKEIVDLHEECDGWEIIVSDLKKDLHDAKISIDKGGSMKHIVEAQYAAYSQWEIDFDLNKVYSWYIKYDTLEIQHKEGDDWVAYSASAEGECDYKRPDKVYQADSDDDDVGDYLEVV